MLTASLKQHQHILVGDIIIVIARTRFIAIRPGQILERHDMAEDITRQGNLETAC